MICQVAVCDDNIQDAEFVRAMLLKWAGERQISVKVELFHSSESFLFRYAEKKEFDLLLLDIEMGTMDGITMAKRVRSQCDTIQIIFITGYADYISEGYDVAALHYLMKPLDTHKLFTVLDRAYEKKLRNERYLILNIPGEMIRLPFWEISYLEVRQNYVTVHAKQDHTVKRALAEFEKELDESFYRVGRAVIVNLKHIKRVTKTEIHLLSGSVIPLPRGAYEPLNRAIIKHG